MRIDDEKLVFIVLVVTVAVITFSALGLTNKAYKSVAVMGKQMQRFVTTVTATRSKHKHHVARNNTTASVQHSARTTVQKQQTPRNNVTVRTTQYVVPVDDNELRVVVWSAYSSGR